MIEYLGFEGVSKSFGAQKVISDFSMRFFPGESFCLMGPTGCGKTTLLRLLMGLEKPDTGQIYPQRPLSAVFQEDRLCPYLSAMGNLRLAAGGKDDEALSALLTELGLDPREVKPVSEYSGGMKRRVAIARALAVPFAILLLDEPFKGLDEDTRNMVAGTILRRLDGRTLILVSHDRAEAALLRARVIHLP